MRKSALVLAFVSLAILMAWSLAAAQDAATGQDPLLKALERDYKPAAPLLPEGVKIAETFKESGAAKIGLTDFVQNLAYVIHADDPLTAYKLVKSQPLFTGDAVIVEEKSSAVLLLDDESRISVNASSKLVLDKSVYNPDKSFRDTLVSLVAGKARFVVTKLGGMFGESNNFEVTTPVGSCGVRGSDFILALVPQEAIGKRETSFLDFFSPAPAYAQTGLVLVAVAGPDTRLSLRGLTGAPVLLTSFTASTVLGGQSPTPPIPTSPTQTPRLFNNLAPSVSVMGMPDFLE